MSRITITYRGADIVGGPDDPVTFGRKSGNRIRIDGVHGQTGRFWFLNGRWYIENRGSQIEFAVTPTPRPRDEQETRLTVPAWPRSSRHLEPPKMGLPSTRGKVTLATRNQQHVLTWLLSRPVQEPSATPDPTPVHMATKPEMAVVHLWLAPWADGNRKRSLTPRREIAAQLDATVTERAVERRIERLKERLCRERVLHVDGQPVTSHALAMWLADQLGYRR